MIESLNGWRTFIISIQANSHKLATTVSLLGSEGLKAEVFYGIDASISGINNTKWTYEVDNPGSNYHIGEKTIALHLSHYMLWKVCSYLDGDAFFILEDDVRFNAGWREDFDAAIASLPPTWGMLHIGSCCVAGKAGNEKVAGKLHRVSSALCTHAYVIRKTTLPLLLNRCEKVWAPTDLAMAFDVMPQIECFAFLPRLADQLNTHLPV